MSDSCTACTAVCTHVLPVSPQVLVVDDGRIMHYAGDFEDYRNELIKEITAELDEE